MRIEIFEFMLSPEYETDPESIQSIKRLIEDRWGARYHSVAKTHVDGIEATVFQAIDSDDRSVLLIPVEFDNGTMLVEFSSPQSEDSKGLRNLIAFVFARTFVRQDA
jgi:glutathione peroxidase-family protein